MFSTTEYNNLINIFEKNKNKKWDEWLDFDSLFDKQGKQGIVGKLTVKENKKKIIFKISQCINFLANHELMIMKGLAELNNYCPHYCKAIGILNCDIEPDRKAKNPFKIKTQKVL